MPAVLIKNGIVVQVDFTGETPDGFIIAPAGTRPGFTFDGSNFAAPTPLPPNEEDIRAEGARRLALIGQPYSPQERETWSQQVLEAKAVLVDVDADTPLLELLAAADGISVTDFATKVKQKTDAFSAAAGAILAAQRALLAEDPIPADYFDDSHWL
jgi:hypothetical protein